MSRWSSLYAMIALAAALCSPVIIAAQNSISVPAMVPETLALLTRASIVAAQDGRIVKLGSSQKLGKYLILRDVYGDVFTYAGLGSIASHYPKPKAPKVKNAAATTSSLPTVATGEAKPTLPATAGHHAPVTLKVKTPKPKQTASPTASGEATPAATGASTSTSGATRTRSAGPTPTTSAPRRCVRRSPAASSCGWRTWPTAERERDRSGSTGSRPPGVP